jgi:hypothetical protein
MASAGTEMVSPGNVLASSLTILAKIISCLVGEDAITSNC